MMKGVAFLLLVGFVSWINAEQQEFSLGKQNDKVKSVLPKNYRGPIIMNYNCGATSRHLLNIIRIMNRKLTSMNRKLTQCLRHIYGPHPGGKCKCKKFPRNCEDLLKCGCRKSGIYTINPDGRARGAFKVYCDQKTKGGGWVVIQRRKDGSVNFYRGWHDYKVGFGNLKGEFWLGLDKIYRLTHQARNRLRVELEDTTGKTAYAEYSYFAVTSAKTFYKLSLGTYSGTAGDSLSGHRGAPFTTKDRDHDAWKKNNCAVAYKGAWWYNACHSSNLNGHYYHGKHKSYADGVNWYSWKGYHYSAKRAEMKIRPA